MSEYPVEGSPAAAIIEAHQVAVADNYPPLIDHPAEPEPEPPVINPLED